MNIRRSIILSAAVLAVAAAFLPTTGCLLSKSTTVTGSTNSAGVFTEVTNTVTTVNTASLALDCTGLQLAGTPALIFAIQSDPSARPIVADIGVALNAALNGADTNVTATINGMLGTNTALQNSIQPLISSASALEQQLLAKYGTNNAVVISKAILQADLNIINAALASVPAK